MTRIPRWQAKHRPQYCPQIAAEVGLIEAILLQQMIYWQFSSGSQGYPHGGYKWIYNTYDSWAEQLGITAKQARTAIAHLEKLGVVIGQRLRAKEHIQTKHYRVDTEHALLWEDAGQIVLPTTAEGSALSVCSICPTGQVSTLSSSSYQHPNSIGGDLECADALASPSDTETPILEVARTWKHYKYDAVKALKVIREMRAQYPSLDLLSIANDLYHWLEDNPHKAGANPLARFRNFCKKQADWDSAKLLSQPAPRRGWDDFDASELAT